MTRQDAMKAIDAIARNFCVDDVKDWLAESCTAQAGEYRRDGEQHMASEYMAVANDLAAVRTRGL